MRVEQVYLRNVGPFREERIAFPPGTDPALADVYLLTGPNGSGKSTVLYAIAAAIAADVDSLGADLISRRFHPRSPLVAIELTGERRALAWGTSSTGRMPYVDDPFGGHSLPLRTLRNQTGLFTQAAGATAYQARAGNFSTQVAPAARPRFSWAAFAYAGTRSIDQVDIKAIEEPTQSPFFDSLSFIKTADPAILATWVANQRFKAFRAQASGRQDRAEALEQSIKLIERVIGDIIDDATFAFVMLEDDNNVRVRHAGQVIEPGLLPDGLKSILSWIADLLMRLDRIPWEGDVSVIERSFLLLLDEIDIHLHPAWQRKVLPIVQGVFPNAQIIASTHSPFVVTSAADAHVITLAVKDGVASVERTETSQVGYSYSAVLRSIFGITSEFDVDTEQMFERFHEAKTRLLRGDASARADVDREAAALAQRSEEVRELVGLELRQLQRQLASRPAS